MVLGYNTRRFESRVHQVFWGLEKRRMMKRADQRRQSGMKIYKQILSTQDVAIRMEISHILVGPPSQDRCKPPSCTTTREPTMYASDNFIDSRFQFSISIYNSRNELVFEKNICFNVLAWIAKGYYDSHFLNLFAKVNKSFAVTFPNENSPKRENFESSAWWISALLST